MRKVPRCMSTQHPDNVTAPFFSSSEVLSGESEVLEAYYVFSQLGCTEQMWDSEGKEADNQVVEKLLSKYPDFFKAHKLGEEFSITYRAPNPSVDRAGGKILLEVLHSIPRAFDAANSINEGVPPIFEVIQPMTTSAEQLRMIRDYYERVIVGQDGTRLGNSGMKVGQWVGNFKPESISIIPLFEDYDSFLAGPSIVEDYMESRKVEEYQRVFLARSDPALNYGSLSAVMLGKITLCELQKLQERSSVDILPILGVGGSPFRGNFRPDNVSNCMEGYPSVQTFTVQSAFKYDYPFRDTVNAIDMVNETKRSQPIHVERKELLPLIEKIRVSYQAQIESISDLINTVSTHVPSRRARKLHVGLFGYSRAMGKVKLPRAIKFCASLYSIGLPPELLGVDTLSESELDKVRAFYPNFDEDMRDSLRYLNQKNLEKLPKVIRGSVSKLKERYGFEENQEYSRITGEILENALKGDVVALNEKIKAAAWMRRFLG
ncbi:MAG: phosphoenolpyruvate carboxylase [Candidatus Bilamarchaeaceae archaeon]